MITVYNRRGYTRLEFQCRDDRADVIVNELFIPSASDNWFKIGVSHLQDFIEFETDWWQEFIAGTGRAWKIVSTPREKSLERTMNWLTKQAAPALSTIEDINPALTQFLLQNGRKRRGGKYELLLGLGRKPREREGTAPGRKGPYPRLSGDNDGE